MRGRTLSAAILADERIAGLTPEAFRLWVGIYLLADDHGRVSLAPAYLLGAVLWASEGRKELVSDLLEQLARAKLLRRYTVDGRSFGEIPAWNPPPEAREPWSQRISNPGKSRVPPPETP